MTQSQALGLRVVAKKAIEPCVEVIRLWPNVKRVDLRGTKIRARGAAR